MSVPMQRYITVSFNVKIGKPQGNSRTYAEPATTFTFDTTEDSFGGLRFKSCNNERLNASIRQLNHIDNEMETIEQERESRARESEQLYREIRFMINGDSVKMVVNIADLRSALGLPQFDLYAPFRAPVPFQDPVNMQDEDHADESNET
ncbi:hypothetical protein AC1031_015676 [Aphanomyces cochlioides]|nr:hypothetical protein AC1031_015676 [Aphanomyces cochlioides]